MGKHVKKKNKQVKPTHLENNFFPIKYKQKEETIVVSNWKITIDVKFNLRKNTKVTKKI